jgi:2-dehydropantoate 2-reductase
MPSFYIDLHSGRAQSEVDYLNGAVVRAGKETGIPTPVNQVLNETLLKLTSGEIDLREYSGRPKQFVMQIPGWESYKRAA